MKKIQYDFLYFRFVRIEIKFGRKPTINYACIKYASLIFHFLSMSCNDYNVNVLFL